MTKLTNVEKNYVKELCSHFQHPEFKTGLAPLDKCTSLLSGYVKIKDLNKASPCPTCTASKIYEFCKDTVNNFNICSSIPSVTDLLNLSDSDIIQCMEPLQECLLNLFSSNQLNSLESIFPQLSKSHIDL